MIAENKKNIFQRMLEVQKEVVSINKNETVKMHDNDKGYKAVSHDDVAAALHLPLAKHGIFMLPNVVKYDTQSFEKTNKYGQLTTWYRTDIEISVKWINVDKPEDFIESTGAAFALDTSDKSFAKAYSLTLKIVLLKVHLLESRDGEEQRPFDDLNNGKPEQRKQPAQQQQRPAQNQQPKKQQQSPPLNSQPKHQHQDPLMTDDQSEQIANLMIRHSFDSSVIEKALTLKNANPKMVSFKIAQEIINALDVDVLDEASFISQFEKKDESKALDPGDFVVNFGNSTKGKKIKEIGESTLKEMRKWADEQLKIVPPVQNAPDLFTFKLKLDEFFKSVGVA